MQPQTKSEVLTLNEKVLYFLVVLTLASSGLSAIENVSRFGLSDGAWRSGWLQNFSTEMMGAIATFILFELVVAARQRFRDKAENTAQLEALREAVTEAVTKEVRRLQQLDAVARLRKAEDETEREVAISELKVRDLLSGIDLNKANLSNSNLNSTNLSNSNLSGADISNSDLDTANLSQSNLAEANFRESNLTYADLNSSNLTDADISHTYLERTILTNSRYAPPHKRAVN